MSRNKFEESVRKLTEYYNQLPDWYWKRGLHDAQIVSVSESRLTPNYKEKNPKYNCLEIKLDSEGALYETDIKKICLYNYKIRTQIDISKKIWWMSDTIQLLDNGKYLLEIEYVTIKEDHKQFVIEFEIPEIERS